MVHLAADTRVIDSVADPVRNFEVNVAGTFGLLNLMREIGVPRLVNASTGGAILGEAPPPVNEQMVPRPASPYGASKASAEAYCSAFAASYGLNVVSLRFSNAYGPLSFHKGSVVAAFMRRILDGAPLVVYGDGSQTRDYVFVEDLCDGIVAALTSGGSGTFQLGSGVGTSLTSLIEQIASVVGPEHLPVVRYEPFRAGENPPHLDRRHEGAGWARMDAAYRPAGRSGTYVGLVPRPGAGCNARINSSTRIIGVSHHFLLVGLHGRRGAATGRWASTSGNNTSRPAPGSTRPPDGDRRVESAQIDPAAKGGAAA